MTTPVRHPAETLLGFALALRAAGLTITADRELTYLSCVAAVGLDDQRGTYLAGRSALCGSPADLERYDLVYDAWFGLEETSGRSADQAALPVMMADLFGSDRADGADDGDPVAAQATPIERLRHRDVADLSPIDKAELHRLFARLRPRAPRRSARRYASARRGRVDANATLRATLRRMGEPAPVRWRRRISRPRRVVLLIDVSGSMNSYADALLRLAHLWVRGGTPVEVFTLGTRLTHVTRTLAQRDPDRALVRTGHAIPDWSGGTRLAQGLKVFLDRWGRRGMARGAVVVVMSDGWERDHPELLGEQMRRLRAVAHRVVWANPHRGHEGYAPVQSGIVASLPHIDDFVAGHSFAAFEDLIEVVSRA